jgi:hypothetical protein
MNGRGQLKYPATAHKTDDDEMHPPRRRRESCDETAKVREPASLDPHLPGWTCPWGVPDPHAVRWSNGARTVGSGDDSTPFVVGLSPAPVVTFPAAPLKFRTVVFPNTASSSRHRIVQRRVFLARSKDRPVWRPDLPSFCCLALQDCRLQTPPGDPTRALPHSSASV